MIQRAADTNLLVALLVTSHARLILFDTMERIGKDLIYTDTESIIYVGSHNAPPMATQGYAIGLWSNEIIGMLSLGFKGKDAQWGFF